MLIRNKINLVFKLMLMIIKAEGVEGLELTLKDHTKTLVEKNLQLEDLAKKPQKIIETRLRKMKHET